jgi:hypothetical protein
LNRYYSSLYSAIYGNPREPNGKFRAVKSEVGRNAP